jgi:hypothetical protein
VGRAWAEGFLLVFSGIVASSLVLYNLSHALSLDEISLDEVTDQLSWAGT